MEESNTISTPVNRTRKSLGVRRSITNYQPNKTPVSDLKKISISQCSQENQLESPTTPLTSISSSTSSIGSKIKLKRLGSRSSTGSNSYKLSLSRTVTDRQNRKKLDFFGQGSSHESEQNQICSPNTSPLRLLPQSPNHPHKSTTTLTIDKHHDSSDFQNINYDSMNEDDLKKEIKKRKQFLADIEKHDEKVNELKKLIEIWENGFHDTFTDLKDKFGLYDNEILLQRLHLPKELIKYC